MSSGVQRFVQRIAPGWAAKLEAETRQWWMVCPEGHEFNVWEIGGIRGGGRGSPVYRRRCPTCGKYQPMRLIKKP